MKQILVFAVLLAVIYMAKGIVPHKVFRISPTTKEQIELLFKYYQSTPQVLFWRFNKCVGKIMDVMISPEIQRNFHRMLLHNGIPYVIFIDHVETLIAANSMETDELSHPRQFNWTTYHTLNEIYTWLDYLANSHSRRVTIITGGLTYNERNIKGIKLSFSNKDKPGIFIEGGINPREWISPATVTYLLGQLLNSKMKDIMALAQSYDWYIFPVINPDGYEYTYQNERSVRGRLWPNTRSLNFVNLLNNASFGVDLNTNWMIKSIGSTPSPKQRSKYHEGNNPFSEVEARSLSSYLTSIADKLIGYISFRGYGQELMYPYGYTLDNVVNYNEQNQIAAKTVQALKKRYNTEYEFGSLKSLRGSIYGNSLDWVKDYLKLPLVYAYDMRDTGNYGLLQPPSEIIPNGQEIMDSLIAMFKEAKKFGYP